MMVHRKRAFVGFVALLAMLGSPLSALLCCRILGSHADHDHSGDGHAHEHGHTVDQRPGVPARVGRVLVGRFVPEPERRKDIGGGTGLRGASGTGQGPAALR